MQLALELQWWCLGNVVICNEFYCFHWGAVLHLFFIIYSNVTFLQCSTEKFLQCKNINLRFETGFYFKQVLALIHP